MRILVLSFYYQPDLCAGSFRTTALVEQLCTQANVEIDVITTMPNRYASYEASAPEFEANGNLNIHRIVLPSHKSGMLDQIKSFITYYRAALKLVKNQQYDVVFATSSRLFTAFLGAVVANKKSIPLYLDIRDIFVDTIKDVLNPNLVKGVKPLLSYLEGYTFTSAQHINLVSRGFEGYFKSRYPSAIYSWFTNGIDNEFLSLPTTEFDKHQTVKKVIYAGNIGEGQGLHTIIPELAKCVGPHYEFKVIGDGGRKAQLESSLGSNNVSLHPPVSREALIREYLQADVLFLHLNDYDAFEKVLPSKVFEYAATGKPILAGVAGYAAEFIRAEVPNAEVFSPGDSKGAISALERLSLSLTDRREFIEKYTRGNIMQSMSETIVALGK